jgi:DNA-binding LacI/PurR family transcriptional regulator
MSEMATLKTLAQQLGVSISTVSRALKNHPRIGLKTKKSVWELAKKMDYQPNRMALNLLGKRSNTIGIIVPKIGYNIYSMAITGIEDVAIEAGFNIMICQSNESLTREISNVHDLLASQADGIIVSLAAETNNYEHFVKILQKEVPLVFFNRVIKNLPSSRVYVDNYQAARSAVDHLAQQGCRKIAFLGGPDFLYISNERFLGFREGLFANDIEMCHDMVVHMEFGQETAKQRMQVLLQNTPRPDGLFAVSDTLAIGAMLAIKEFGMKIPDDIAVVGFNNDPVCQLLSPTLSSIDQNPYAMGRMAAILCLKQLDNLQERENEINLPTKLVVRESSEKFRSTSSPSDSRSVW